MCIAGCFAHFIGDDGLVDAPMSVTCAPNDQTVDIPVWRTDAQVSHWLSPRCASLAWFVMGLFSYTGSFCALRCSRCACRCGTSRWLGRAGPPPCISAPPLCLRSPPHRPEVWQSPAWSSSPPRSPAPLAPLGWMASSPAWTWRKEGEADFKNLRTYTEGLMGLFYFCHVPSLFPKDFPFETKNVSSDFYTESLVLFSKP